MPDHGAGPPGDARAPGFRNLLIWGDNKLALAALLDQFRGQVDLIYIDPPFDAGADYTVGVPMGGEASGALPEALAYRDRWGSGADSYLHMMWERLVLLRELLAETGSIFVHCDYRVSYLLRALLVEVFGDTLRNEIIWCYTGPGSPGMRQYSRKHDTIYWFTRRRDGHKFRGAAVRVPHDAKTQANFRPGLRGSGFTADTYDLPDGKIPEDWWQMPVAARYPIEGVRRTGYATEKPWRLLERILQTASEEGDLVLDCFCGSGTTLAVAETLGRRWIGCDLGRHAIHTTRKRMVALQGELSVKGEPHRPFDLYTLGSAERRWWQIERLGGSDERTRETVLGGLPVADCRLPIAGHAPGTHAGAVVHVAGIERIVAWEELRAVVEAAAQAGAPGVWCLAWEFETDLRKRADALAADLGICIELRQVPREIMEPNRGEVILHGVGVVEAEVVHGGDGLQECGRVGERVSGGTTAARAGMVLPRSPTLPLSHTPTPPLSHTPTRRVDVRLTHFLPPLPDLPERELARLRQRAAQAPFDFVDFWAVDFDHYEGKGYFEHHWQAYRTRKERSLTLESDRGWVYRANGRRRIGVKVIDVFGFETATSLDVDIP